MSEVITDYFRRFDNSITESVYSCLTIDDLYKNKALFEYLDYVQQNLFRTNKLYCGIRNIDNSCYLSSTLQILYHIQWLRERIFRIPEQEATEFLRELQKLFALMYKGTLVYVDPSSLFAVLKKIYPDVFVPGSQNDFHQVFTLILDQLEKSLVNEDDKKCFRKLFFGRMKVQILDEKGKVTNSSSLDLGNSFNLINLLSSQKNFDAAVWNFKNQIIEGYKNQQGDKVNASKQIHFVETPAVLSFFINRVTFQNNKVVKDISEFDFEEQIMFAKSSGAKSLKQNQDIEHSIKELTKWITEIKQKSEFLVKTIQYLEESDSEFVSINTPTIENSAGIEAKKTTRKYLQAELEGIQKQIVKSEAEIVALQKRRLKEAEDNYTELYSLWGVMIHCGNTADSGHYKICLKVDSAKNVWAELNDRRTEEISYDKILSYKKKGEICCLFYQRSSLSSQPEKSHISSSLKKFVQEEEQKLFKSIDNARLLQSLYQQFESASMIWQFENASLRQQEKVSNYFFKPLLHLTLTGCSPQTCKAYLLYQMIKQPKFISSIINKSIDQSRHIEIPNIELGIPQEYWKIAEVLKEFLVLEFSSPIEAYDYFSMYMGFKSKNQITNVYFKMLREVLVLKAIFYEALYIALNMLDNYEDLSKTVDNMLKFMTEGSFVQKIKELRTATHEKFINKIMENEDLSVGILYKQSPISPFLVSAALFAKRFGYWIDQRKKQYLNASAILSDYEKFYASYGQILN